LIKHKEFDQIAEKIAKPTNEVKSFFDVCQKPFRIISKIKDLRRRSTSKREKTREIYLLIES